MTEESRPRGAPTPDDRELEQYLKGDSPLSRRYRDASAESAPPELDEAILAQARAELRRKPVGINRWLAPVALAASVVLGVNLAWNVYQVQPMPGDVPSSSDKVSRDEGFVPSPPPAAEPPAEPVAPRANAPAAPAEPVQRPERKMLADDRAALKEESTPAPSAADELAQGEADLTAKRQQEQQQSLRKAEVEERSALERQSEESAQGSMQARAPAAASAPAPAPKMADAAPLSESGKIDRLLRYIGSLQGAVFIRNGEEHGPAEAAKHLQNKREKAGDRVRTADDFIRLCASHSSASGDAYLIRFADGRTRTAEDVLREELARM